MLQGQIMTNVLKKCVKQYH